MTSIRTILTGDPHALGFSAPPLLTWHGDEDDRPVGGGTAYMGWSGLIGVTRDYRHHISGDLATLDGATHVTVPATTWGDYVGDDIQRSNARSLVRDMPDAFITVSGDYSSEYLALDLDTDRDDDDLSHLIELIRDLADQYPLYDEDDWSQLTVEMSAEDWRTWAGDDAARTYRDALIAAGMPDDDMTDDYLTERVNLTALVDEWMSDGIVTYEAECAVSGAFLGLDDALTAHATDAARQYLSTHS